MPSDSPADDARPRITGSTSNIVRVAVVQIAFHPAVRGSLVDPMGRFDPGGTLPLSTLPKELGVSDHLREAHKELSDRVRQAYVEQLTEKLRVVLGTCRAWGVKLVVLPEYSVPYDALEAVAEESRGMVVVAGSGFVDRAVQASGIYEKLGASRPGLRENLAVVLHEGRLVRTIAKLRPSKEEVVPEVNPGSAWDPVDLPDGWGPLGVLICLDFLDRQHEVFTKLVAPKLNQCRLLAVPALTSEGSLTYFQGHSTEESGPGRRPVLFANWAAGGGSTIAVHERSMDEREDFPNGAGVLDPGEEGVLVADIDLAVGAVGKSGRYGEAPLIRPFAAASLVYSGLSKELAGWHASLRAEFLEDADESDEEVVLDRATAWLSRNPPPQSAATPMQRRRWDRLLLTLDDATSLSMVSRLTRDIVLPPGVLPLPEVENALARGASLAINGWVRREMNSSAAFATVADSLSDKAKRGEATRAAWMDASRQTWKRVVETVRSSSAESHMPMATSPLDRATETVENRVVKAALDRGNALAKEGRYEEAAEAYLTARDEAQKQESNNDTHGDKWRTWMARALIGAASCEVNLQASGRARTLAEEIPTHVLDSERRLRLATIWAAVGDVEKARAILPAPPDIPDELRSELRDVVQRIGLVEGDVPPLDELSPSPDIATLAAHVLLGRHEDAARAAQVAYEVLGGPDDHPLIRAQAVHTLVTAVMLSVADLVPQGNVIPVASRAEIVRAIEAHVPAVLTARLPTVIASGLTNQWRRFLEVSADVDALEVVPERDAGVSVEDGPLSEAVRTAQRLVSKGYVEAGLAALPVDEHPWRTRLTRVELLMEAEHWERALMEALELASDVPDRAPIELMASQLLSRHERHEEALDHAKRAATALPARGLRLRLAQCLLALGRAAEAWELLAGDEASGGPRTLRALAIAADTVQPQRAVGLWERYVGYRPEDHRAKIHRAGLLAALHREQEAANIAWALFEQHADTLALDLMHAAGTLQNGFTQASERRRRKLAIAGKLKQRFPSDAEAENIRLSLLVTDGLLDAADVPIDFRLLQKDGLIQAISTDELLGMFRRQRGITELVGALGKRGSLPIASQCAASGTTAPLLITRLLRRDQGEVPFSTAVHLSDYPGVRIEDSDLLVSEVELYFLASLGVLDRLASLLKSGRVHLLQSAWTRVADDRAQLRSLTDDSPKGKLTEVIHALARLPRTGGAQTTLERGGAVVVRTAGGDGVPEEHRVSPRTVLQELRDQGRITEQQYQTLVRYYPDDPGTTLQVPTESPLLVDLHFLEVLWRHDALSEFVDAFPTTCVGERDWGRLLSRQSEAIEQEEAFRVTDMVHAWIADGMENGWLRLEPDPPVGGLPILREEDDDIARSFVLEPLEWTARYAQVLSEQPAWWRLSADIVGSTLPINPEGIRLLRWNDADSEIRSLVRRLRAGSERRIGLPQLVRVLHAAPEESATRDATLRKLAQLGFSDALGSREVITLFKDFGRGEVARRVLSRMEWMAREPNHPGGDTARFRIADVYAAAILEPFCRTGEGDEITENPQVTLAPAEREALARALLARAEHLLRDSSADFLELLFDFVAERAMSEPRLVWKQDEHSSMWSERSDSPLSDFWRFLEEWAGEDRTRRSALERGVREAWLAIDKREDQVRTLKGTALAMAVSVPSGKGELHLTGLAFEAESMLSANWGYRPLQKRGVTIGAGEKEENLRFEDLLQAAGRPGHDLRVDADGRFVVFRHVLQEGDTFLRVFAPVEAVLLRLSPKDAGEFAAQLKRMIGPHDGKMYRLLNRLERSPQCLGVRQAFARRAATTLWRDVRDDPTYIVRWPKAYRPSMRSSPSLKDLRMLLSEPNGLESGDHLGPVLFHRQIKGFWRNRADRWELFHMAMEVPGQLSFGPVWTLLEHDYEKSVDEALSILEHVDEHPIARAARSIFLLRAGATKQPVLTLPSGETVDLRERVPRLFSNVLKNVVEAPRPGTFGAAEPSLMRVCVQVLNELAGPSPLSIREGLWLTYRLFQWLCIQLDTLLPNERSFAIKNLSALAPAVEPPRDLLDPRGFDRDRFDHRLAAVLHALGSMEEVVVAVRTSKPKATRSLRLVWHPSMIEALIELAKRLDEPVGLGSQLPWEAPDNVADLAMAALLKLDPNAFDRVPSEARLRRFVRLPANPDGMSPADRALFQPLVTSVTTRPNNLSTDEREAIVSKLRAAPDGTLAKQWRMAVFAGLFAAKDPDIDEREALQALFDALDDSLAPLGLTYMLFGVANDQPERMGEVLSAVIEEAERREVDPVPFAAGVGRVFLQVEEPARQMVVDLVRELSSRHPFKDDERMRELMTAFGED